MNIYKMEPRCLFAHNLKWFDWFVWFRHTSECICPLYFHHLCKTKWRHQV